ncbi:MAG: phosphomethylpyrimidine kinase [Bacillales bacterium]|jgi:hydroxymethylpyrimidine/phosphomethylpyrimidine kinase|nr:phosphomethylpyrimidine kinase [Bacillales bacterium]
MKVCRALTIAGSDSGGGAGIQADLKTFQELGVYGMSAITAVTAQNTLGVQGVYPLKVEEICQQIKSIGDDIGADAVKTGMLFSADIINAVATEVTKYNWANLVVDPVMISKGGATLLQQEAVDALIRNLIPLSMVVTPNIPEAEVLANININNLDDRKKAARKIKEMGTQFVVIKGGHDESGDIVTDLIYDGRDFEYIDSKRVKTMHTHGTGCTFSAAIAAELAKGKDVVESINNAKMFIKAAIEDELGIGVGHGPTNHWAFQKRKRGESLGIK